MPETQMRLAGESNKPIPKRIPFTEARLKALTCPPSKRYTRTWDTKALGLVYIVTNKGARSFRYERRIKGRLQSTRIGGAEINVDTARAAALDMANEQAKGHNPFAARAAEKAAHTLGQLWTVYLEQHSKVRNRSWKDDERRYTKHLEAWKNRKLAEITRADVQALHNRIGKGTHAKGKKRQGQANRVLALLSSMFNRARTLANYDGQNPCEGVQRFKEESRERFLGANELQRFLLALDAADTPADWRDVFALLLWTGARRANVLGMKWADIELKAGVWTIPGEDAKAGKAIKVSLSDKAKAILEARKDNGSEFVFPGPSATGHLVEPRKQWEALLKRAKLDDVRLHDLRRTLASWMVAGGASLVVVGKHLGHQNVSTTAVYGRLDLTPVKAAVDKATIAMEAVKTMKEKPATDAATAEQK